MQTVTDIKELARRCQRGETLSQAEIRAMATYVLNVDWIVELRDAINRDVKTVKIAAQSAGDAMQAAVASHPTYRVRSVVEAKK